LLALGRVFPMNGKTLERYQVIEKVGGDAYG
jgi:hypothetical protein